MAVKIGFVLITHNSPRQAIRLVSRLNSMFGHPSIAWHHDFTFCDLPLDSITTNVSLVRPHLRTSWAKFSVIEATVRAVEVLFRSHSPPDWFVLLSGADYPIKSAAKIVDDLSNSRFDAHIHFERISYKNYQRDWQRLCYDRYFAVKLRVPLISRKLRPTTRTISLRHPFFAARVAPFSTDFSCFAGGQWFCANASAAEFVLEFHRTKPALANYYRRQDVHTIFPEESYFQTILCNSHLQMSQNDWRYTDWSENDGWTQHPKTLVMEDFSKLCESTAHFARKFNADLDSGILDALDERILN